MNHENKPITLLFNPFFYIAGVKALGLGLAAILLAGLVGSWSHTHFDGVLDTHTGAPAPLWFFFAEGLIDWLCLFIVLWICGKIISRSAFRAVDLLGTQALARWPAFIMSLLTLPKAFQRFGIELLEQLKQGKFQFNTGDAIVFFAVVIAMIPFVCWMVVMMYQSFSVSCNVKGGKAIGTFVAGLLVAEILSKLCLMLVIQHVSVPAIIPARSAPAGLPAAGAQGVPAGSINKDADVLFAGLAAGEADLLAKRDFARAVSLFDSTMKGALPEPKLREVWQTLQQQVGPFRSRAGSADTRVEEQDGYKIVFIPCQFERAALDMKVVFDSNRQVAGLFFVPANAAANPPPPKGN